MDKLGIEPNLLIAQLVNFIIIVAVLNKLLYKPVLGMLEKRKKTIAEGIALTQSMKEEEEKLHQKSEKVLAQARSDAKDIIEEAKKQAKEEGLTILSQARASADDVLVKGKQEVEAERSAMQKGVEREAIELAQVMASRLLAESLGDKAQHDILKKHIEGISKIKVS